MKLAELHSPEVAELARDLVVLVPVASLEQHSLHLPLFTDSMIMEEVIRRLEARLPDDVLALPVMWLGYSRHHIRFPGTVSARSSTHLNLMIDIVSSLVDYGFEKLLIVNSHGGNEANIAVLLQHLMEKYGHADIFACTPYTGPASKKIEEIQEAGPKGSGHAGEMETSMILALHPNLVNTNRLQADGQHASLNLPGVKNYRRIDRRTAHGGIGDPRTATAEKGERFFEAAVDGLTETVRRIRAEDLYGPS